MWGIRPNRLAETTLADWLEARVGPRVEISPIFDLECAVVEADVTRHEGFRSVIETDRRSIFEGVADELRSVGIHELDAL